jgi:hypothetical protein
MMVMVIMIQPAAAQSCIPEGATIDSATFSIFVTGPTGAQVDIHRITAPWMETGVTWSNFGESYDVAVVGSLVGIWGWQSVDLTSVVQAWVEGTYDNYGLILRQIDDPSWVTVYRSSESTLLELRPKLEVCYDDGAGVTCVTIQRPGDAQAGVADAMISEGNTNYNGGSVDPITTWIVSGLEKPSLIWFDIEVCPPDGPGTGTPGYWMNHPEAWPVEEITIGGIAYSREDAIGYMLAPVEGDKTFTMFPALVAAKLNVLIGNDDSCIADFITNADAWMATYGPVGSGIAASSEAWEMGEPLYEQLDLYNNGDLCAPSRDALEELEEEEE